MANHTWKARRAANVPVSTGGCTLRGVPVAVPESDDDAVEDNVEALAALLEEEDNDSFDTRHGPVASVKSPVAPGSLMQETEVQTTTLEPEPCSPHRSFTCGEAHSRGLAKHRSLSHEQVKHGRTDTWPDVIHGQITLPCNADHISHNSTCKTGADDVGQPFLQNDKANDDEQCNGRKLQKAGRKEQTKVIGAARQWLRARRSDPVMLQRLQALSRLSRGESQRFVADNQTRQPGEWNLAVLDARINAYHTELSALDMPFDHGHDNSVPADDGTVAHLFEEGKKSEERMIQGELRGDNRHSTAVASDPTQVETPKPITAAKRQCVHASSNQPRRRFMPRFPPQGLQMHDKTEQSNSTTRWVPSSAIEEPVSERKGGKPDCCHARQSKVDAAGCCWVCLDCGEELYYDGWHHEYSAQGAYPSLPGAAFRAGWRA